MMGNQLWKLWTIFSGVGGFLPHVMTGIVRIFLGLLLGIGGILLSGWLLLTAAEWTDTLE